MKDVDKARDGQKIKTCYGKETPGQPDSKSAGKGKMGGSTTNLSHSLSGSSANQKGG